MKQADIGLVGLAVMGQNLALNINDYGYSVAVFNRTTSTVDKFLSGPAKGSNIVGCHSLNEFVQKLKRPRKIILMIKAGASVDEFINNLTPLLDKGDIIIDGGNSHFVDTNRRCQDLKNKGILFIGTGISGGEEGARLGPSIMPGGNSDAWPHVKEIFESIAAKTDKGETCCSWIGDGGAGHYVKMIHNGIEYGDIQLICEAYSLLSHVLDLSSDEIANIFENWNKRELNSYLIEITSNIFRINDTDGSLLLDKILDVAGQKDTGKWTTLNALDLGVPITLIAESVFFRSLSVMKDERVEASHLLKGPDLKFQGDKNKLVEDIFYALYGSKIISYAQGFMLMRKASQQYNWDLSYENIALIWRGGCIIRSIFLNKIAEAFAKNPNINNLLLDDFFKQTIVKCEASLRNVVVEAVRFGLPIPCFSSAISFYDGYRSERLPSNLLQALRDYFGAHTYERCDKKRGEFFHTNWSQEV